jgi:predicted TIM-barrel fold metal-dependent hydrolase
MGLTKSFPVFDCDAHVNDPLQIWEYVPESERELVRQTYWRDNDQGWLNGTTRVTGGGSGEFGGMYNPICIAGPQMNKKIMRKLITMVPLTDEQRDYVEHKGAYDPHARIREMDLMGIDQVLVIPTEMIANLPFAENAQGVDALCRAYNNWARDWCAEVPGRLFPAALLPLQDPEAAAREVRRVADLGFRVALIRPIDARGAYPNDIGVRPDRSRFAGPSFDVVFRALEETGVVLGMHTFPAHEPGRTAGPGLLATPGELVNQAEADSQTMSFIFEMHVWLAQVLLSGFLDRYSSLKMAIFESNSEWLPYLLETTDRLWELYANEREQPAKRTPSQVFYDQCVISFESDEVPTMRQWDRFEDVAIWASDCYHHDGADSWSAMREMARIGVPDEVQAKMLGGNARRMYGIEPQLFVTEEPPPIERPAWFPQGPEFEQWAEQVARPRKQAEAVANR